MARPATTPLQQISPDEIRKNPDNPRLIFLEDEMNELLESIREVGIKVPISVYEDKNKFVLLDGERRWRCAKRLNLSLLPAIIQPKPTRLENLLMMFNIHNVRVDWDLMPMALKLAEIRRLLENEKKDSSANALAAVTGVRLPTVRRALELLEMPLKYQRLLLREAGKPRNERQITADLFIEINKSANAIARHVPDVFEEVSQPKYVDLMVKKYRSGVVQNVVAFRTVSKIARAHLAGGSKRSAAKTLVEFATTPAYSINQAFEITVEAKYLQRDIVTRARALVTKLQAHRNRPLARETRDALVELQTALDDILHRA